MELYKGKKYKIRLSGMIIDGVESEAYVVWLDKCLRSVVLGMSIMPILYFADKDEFKKYCDHSGAAKIGRRVVVDLDVVVMAVFGKGQCPRGSYPAVSDMVRLGTYKLAKNAQFDASEREYEYLEENNNDPEIEWPEEEPQEV